MIVVLVAALVAGLNAKSFDVELFSNANGTAIARRWSDVSTWGGPRRGLCFISSFFFSSSFFLFSFLFRLLTRRVL